MAKYNGTLLVESDTLQKETVNRSILDLLKKINELADGIELLNNPVEETTTSTIVNYTTPIVLKQLTIDTTYIVNSSTAITLDLTVGATTNGLLVKVINIGTGACTVKWNGLVDNVVKTNTTAIYTWANNKWMPTTAISGTNSNGSFTLYPDGTMTQWGNLSGTSASVASLTLTATFPLSFIDTVYTATACIDTSTAVASGIYLYTTSTMTGKAVGSYQFRYVYNDTTARVTTYSISWIATGRWIA